MKIEIEANIKNITVSFVDLIFMICSTASTMSLSINKDFKNRALLSSPTNVPTVESTVSGCKLTSLPSTWTSQSLSHSHTHFHTVFSLWPASQTTYGSRPAQRTESLPPQQLKFPPRDLVSWAQNQSDYWSETHQLGNDSLKEAVFAPWKCFCPWAWWWAGTETVVSSRMWYPS